MITFTKRTISALLIALLVGTPIMRAQNEGIASPFRAVLNAASQGGKFPIVINQHITHVQNTPTQESATTLSKVGSFVGNAVLTGCGVVFKTIVTHPIASTIVIGGIYAYYKSNKNLNDLKLELNKVTQELEDAKAERVRLLKELEESRTENKALHNTTHEQIQQLTEKIEQNDKKHDEQIQQLTEKISKTDESIINLTEQMQNLVKLIGQPEGSLSTTVFDLLKRLSTFGLTN